MWQPQAPDYRKAKDVWQPQVLDCREAKDVWQPQAPDYREAGGRACGWMCILFQSNHLHVRKAGKELHEHPGDKWNDAGYRPSRLREVQYGEFAVVSHGGPVVCFGRPDFTTEASELYRLAVNANSRLPEPLVAFPANTLVFRTGSSICVFCSVLDILRGRGWAQINLSIVQLVVIDVIHE